MNEHTCGQCCKGSAPYFMCRHTRCICHLAADLQAQLTPNRLGHRDTTADTAIGNLTNNRKKKRP